MEVDIFFEYHTFALYFVSRVRKEFQRSWMGTEGSYECWFQGARGFYEQLKEDQRGIDRSGERLQ